MNEYCYNQLHIDIVLFINRVNNDSVIYSNFFQVLRDYGFRFKELQRLDLWIAINETQYEIPALKRGNNRIVNFADLPEYVRYQLFYKDFTFNLITQSSIGYYFKSMFGKVGVQHKTKHLTTHLFRHHRAKELITQGYTDMQVKDYLGEKIQVSADNYINSVLTYQSVQII